MSPGPGKVRLGRYYLIKFIFYLLFVDVLIAMNEQVVSFEYPPVEDDSVTQSTSALLFRNVVF